MRNKERYVILFFFILNIFFLISFLYAENCDPSILLKAETGSTGYQQRGLLCEGFYKSDISRTMIDIVGLTAGTLSYQLENEEIIKISSYIPNLKIKVRAVGIPMKLYYRMDTEINPGETREWPTKSVIKKKEIPAQDIGILGWIGNAAGLKYIPLILNSANKPDNLSDVSLNIYFRATEKVNNVMWRSAIKDKTGKQIFNDWKQLDETTYQAGRPIKVTISLPFPLPDDGELYFEIAVKDMKNEWLKKHITLLLK